MLFEEFVAKWKRSARGARVSKSWAATQDQVIRAHILPILCRMELKNISPEHISRVIEASREKGHAPNTTKKIYMVLSKLFSDAVEFFELIDKSPVKKKYHLPYIPPIERPYETLERSLIVLDYVMGHAIYALPIWIMLLGGLRISEVQSLQWGDVDFEAEILRVRSSYCETGKEIRPYTKNKNQYTVPICPMLYAFLWNRRKKCGFVCCSPEGGMISRWSLRSYIKVLKDKLQLKISSSHGLRHSCARIFVEKGASDEQIMELLGHKWLASSKTYTHRLETNFLKNISKKIV